MMKAYRTLFCTGVLLFGGVATAGNASTPAETATLLKTPVAEKEAVIWYIGHHSFAIKTKIPPAALRLLPDE